MPLPSFTQARFNIKHPPFKFRQFNPIFDEEQNEKPKSSKMALTASNMLPLGTAAPDFRLKDTNSNSYYSFEDLKGSKGTLVMFICNHCPYVKYVIDEVVKVANDYRVQGLGIMAISSNDAEKYPQDGPE